MLENPVWGGTGEKQSKVYSFMNYEKREGKYRSYSNWGSCASIRYNTEFGQAGYSCLSFV